MIRKLHRIEKWMKRGFSQIVYSENNEDYNRSVRLDKKV